LDLLLDLIRQQKMSIHDIQISTITAQYLDYLHKLEERTWMYRRNLFIWRRR